MQQQNEVLSSTPEMLPVLKEAGVVDSGGQGLVQVLKGAYDAFLGKEIDYTVECCRRQRQPLPCRICSCWKKKRSSFGYCTEFIIMLKKAFTEEKEQEFKAFLESIGDSIVCVADDEIVKVHVHTNDPGQAISRGADLWCTVQNED